MTTARALSSTAPTQAFAVTLLDGTFHEIQAREVHDAAGRIQFFSGWVYDEQPELVAVFRAALVAHWRVLT